MDVGPLELETQTPLFNLLEKSMVLTFET
jgi:hypothetical protein